MLYAQGIQHAQRYGRKVVRHFGITAPHHVDIVRIAAGLGAPIVASCIDGANAQLVRTGREVKIMVSDREINTKTQAFNIGHEVSHLVLDHPSVPHHALFEAQRALVPGERDIEAEANVCAAEILMPANLMKPFVQTRTMELAAIEAVAEAFRISILAAARRLIPLSPHACAVVFTNRAGVIQWHEQSKTFAGSFAAGVPIDLGSLAHAFGTCGDLPGAPRLTPATAWPQVHGARDLLESAIASRDFGTV